MSLRARSALEFAERGLRPVDHSQIDIPMHAFASSPTFTASQARRRYRAIRDYPGIPDA